MAFFPTQGVSKISVDYSDNSDILRIEGRGNKQIAVHTACGCDTVSIRASRELGLCQGTGYADPWKKFVGGTG